MVNNLSFANHIQVFVTFMSVNFFKNNPLKTEYQSQLKDCVKTGRIWAIGCAVSLPASALDHELPTGTDNSSLIHCGISRTPSMSTKQNKLPGPGIRFSFGFFFSFGESFCLFFVCVFSKCTRLF